MASKVRLLERLVTSRQISCLHKNAASCAFQDSYFKPASRIKRLQGCHFHFQSYSTSSSHQDPLVHNHGVISSWQTRFLSKNFSYINGIVTEPEPLKYQSMEDMDATTIILVVLTNLNNFFQL